MDEPFVVGAVYRVRASFAAPRDRFEAGEVLVYWSSAYSAYDGMRGYFFRQPGTTRVRSWDLSEGDAVRPEEHFEQVAVPGPVMEAVASGDVAALGVALEDDASPVELVQREMALERVTSEGQIESMELLLGALEPDGDLDEKMLRKAASSGRADAVRIFLARGVDPNCLDGAGQTPLIHGACSGDVRTVQVLLEAGSDPTIRTSGGTAARELAAARRLDEIVQLLDGWSELGREQGRGT